MGYHHCDLRRAIIAWPPRRKLAERDWTAFLIAAGVSARVGAKPFTAPAHISGESPGLIDRLAERGFRRLLDWADRPVVRALPPQTADEPT